MTVCGTCSYTMREHGRPWCIWCERDLLSMATTLARNLSVAGFGALMFKAGDTYGFHMGGDGSYDSNAEQCTCQWRPGTGEPYRPRSRCEHDNDDYEYDEPEVELDDLDEYDPPAVAGPNGCTCGFNGDCNCRFVP